MFEIVNNITEIWDRFGKFALPICFLIILISFNWYIHKDTIVESLQKWSLVINIALIIAVIITSLFSYGLIDFTKKNLDDSSFLIVISPFQSFGSSENLKEYDFGTSQSIKRDLEGFANVSVEILDKNDAINNFEQAKIIANQKNAHIVLFGESIDAYLGSDREFDCSVYISDRIKNKNTFTSSNINRQSVINSDFVPIHKTNDISSFKGQIKDVVNLIFGLEKYFSNDYSGALIYFTNVSEKSINSDVYVYIGYSQLNLNLVNESLESYNKSLSLNPNNEYALNDLGIIYQNQGKYNESISLFDKSISINSKYPASWSNKGVSLFKMGNYNESEKCFDKALEIDPNSLLGLINKGTLTKNRGDYNSTLKLYDKALSINPNYPIVWVIRGGILNEQLNRKEEALVSFDKAIALDPNLDLAWYGKGIAYYNFANYDEAINCFKKAIEINPSYYEAQNYLGMSYGQKKEYSLAEQTFIKAIEIDPNQTIAQNNLLHLFDISGKEIGYEIKIPVKNNTTVIVCKGCK
jgi:tetratricopeptide (TPR) repeat protein